MDCSTPGLPVHHQLQEFTQTHVHWVGVAIHQVISSSVIPFSSCLQSFPASGSFQISQFFASGGQSIGASASASVLPMHIPDWFPLGLTGWISWQSKGLSRDFFNATIQKHLFFGTQLSHRAYFLHLKFFVLSSQPIGLLLSLAQQSPHSSFTCRLNGFPILFLTFIVKEKNISGKKKERERERKKKMICEHLIEVQRVNSRNTILSAWKAAIYIIQWQKVMCHPPHLEADDNRKWTCRMGGGYPISGCLFINISLWWEREELRICPFASKIARLLKECQKSMALQYWKSQPMLDSEQ